MPKIKPVIIEALNASIERNIYQINYRKQGNHQRLRDQFVQETGHNITTHLFVQTSTRYRKEYDISMELNENKYYKPRSNSA